MHTQSERCGAVRSGAERSEAAILHEINRRSGTTTAAGPDSGSVAAVGFRSGSDPPDSRQVRPHLRESQWQDVEG